jgi:hypothetical protein
MRVLEDLIVEVRYTVRIPKAEVGKIMDAAEDLGCGYGDPGKKELVRRFLVDKGIDGICDILPGFNSFQEN